MKVILKAAIVQDGKYLVIKRSPDSHIFPSLWDFPGGKLEPGEELDAGIVREVREETTLEVRPVEVLKELDLQYQNMELHFHIFSVELLLGEVQLSKEHTDFQWLSKEEILKLETEPFIPLFFAEH